MNLYGFETFEEWYVKNCGKANLIEVEERFDLKAIPQRRINEVTLMHHLADDSLNEYVTQLKGNLVIVYEHAQPSIDCGMKVKSSIGYLPSLLVKLRESGIEVTKLYSYQGVHKVQIESINEKLNDKERFNCEIILTAK